MTARATLGSLRLAQFRSWAVASVETGGRPVALTGPNGAGKTNLLEAVSLLVPGRGLRRAGLDEMVRRPERLGWRVAAEIDTGSETLEIRTGVEAGEAETRRTVEIDGKAAAQTALGRHLRQVWLTPAMDRLWLEGAAERRQFLDRIAMGFEPSHAEAAIAHEKAMRARNRLLRDERDGGSRADPAWLGGLEAQMARAAVRIARVRAEALAQLRAAQEEATTAFPRADLAIEGEMETRFAAALDAGRDLDALEAGEAAEHARSLGQARARDAAAGRTLEGPHRSDLEAVYAPKGMPARTCSTGEQKALLLSLCLANARALSVATGAAPLILMDEVAAHLDAARRRALYAEIGALGAQAWMTGTGPELFDGLDGALRLGIVEGASGSRLEPL